MKRPYKYVKERKKYKKGKRRNRHPSAHNGEEDPLQGGTRNSNAEEQRGWTTALTGSISNDICSSARVPHR